MTKHLYATGLLLIGAVIGTGCVTTEDVTSLADLKAATETQRCGLDQAKPLPIKCDKKDLVCAQSHLIRAQACHALLPGLPPAQQKPMLERAVSSYERARNTLPHAAGSSPQDAFTRTQFEVTVGTAESAMLQRKEASDSEKPKYNGAIRDAATRLEQLSHSSAKALASYYRAETAANESTLQPTREESCVLLDRAAAMLETSAPPELTLRVDRLRNDVKASRIAQRCS